HLEKLLPWVFACNTAPNVAAPNVVFSNPEKQQANARRHCVVVLNGVAWCRADPVQGFGDRSAIRRARRCGGKQCQRKNQSEKGKSSAKGGPHLRVLPSESRGIRWNIMWAK